MGSLCDTATHWPLDTCRAAARSLPQAVDHSPMTVLFPMHSLAV